MYRNRGQTLDMEAVTELTADTFHSAVADNPHMVVLFYVKCKTGFCYTLICYTLLESINSEWFYTV